ncbi:NAD(P)-binding protein [Daldinia sp. FL1419]|nr:NAD(P)-binding protein [Daldinia sp. FL1419]
MPSYVIAGASRGLGFEFLRQLSADPSAVVIGLVRNKEATEKKVASEIGRSNIHILHGDLDDYESLKKSAEETAKITGGGLDYLIANGAYLSGVTAFTSLHDHADEPKILEDDLIQSFKTNAVGNIHLFNLYLPLIKKGNAKKVVSISTGIADYDLVKRSGHILAGPYTLSKAALNLAVLKFHNEFHKEGILFFSISPGVVATDGANHSAVGLTEKQTQRLNEMFAQFAEMEPHFKGPITPEESVRLVMQVIYNASLERGDGGSFVSQHGNRERWL